MIANGNIGTTKAQNKNKNILYFGVRWSHARAQNQKGIRKTENNRLNCSCQVCRDHFVFTAMPRAVKAKPNVPVGAKKATGAKRTNKLYAMPEKIAEGTVLTDLSKTQWKVGPSIGVGGFGEIYSACRVGEKSYEYVVKCEPHGNGPLFVEMHFYMRNAKLEDILRFKREKGLKSLGMPYMLGNGSTELKGQKHRFIVMPRYGSDVAKHFQANNRRLPEGTVYRIALQMLDVYEFVHACGYVHADLKAANILLGYGKGGGSQAYLVDYGLASHYTTKEFKPDPKKMHNGTIEYTSRDAHLGVPTMRADLEILGYNIIEWLGVQLPWVRDNLLPTPAKVQKSKEDFMSDVVANIKRIFPKGVPAAVADYMKYVAKMQYNETPDYDKCRKLFVNALKTLHVPNNGDLEFNMTGTNNNNNQPQTKQRKLVTHDTSIETICASDDDDGDVIFERKPPIKAAPNKPLKTVNNNVSPQRKVLKRSPLKRPLPSPSNMRKSPNRISPRSPIHSPPKNAKMKISPNVREQQKKTTKFSPQRKRKIDVEEQSVSSRSASRITPQKSSSASSGATPTTTRAHVNIRPVISATTNSAGRTRHGKTVINDQLTPNGRAGKTYEFNVELDVSMDANVIVNVKRKKKAVVSSQNSRKVDDDDTPTTSVKVRKIASDDDASSGSPIVTVKKTKRMAGTSPRGKK